MAGRRPQLPILSEPVAPDLSARVAEGLARLAEIGHLSAWRTAQELGVSATQLHVLRLLSSSPMRPSDLARLLDVSLATTSDSVAALERKHLVTRAREAEDRRVVRVELTRKGRALVERVDRGSAAMRAAVERLSVADQRVLHAAVVKVIEGLQDAGAITGARTCRGCSFFREHAHVGPRPHHCAFVDAPLADHELRADCPDHEAA